MLYSLMIKEGELFILYSEKRHSYLLRYEKGMSFSTNLGNVIIKDGVDYGDILLSNREKKFFILRPSNYDLIKKVQRKTSILYPKDIGYMILSTGIGSGSIVAEVGSGSGALTTALAKVVGEKGKIYSFERREEHIEVAKKNMTKYGFSERVEFILKDTAKEGFGDIKVEAIFVDLPEPWAIAGHAYKILESGGFWVSLVPNFEQLKQLHFALLKNSFIVERNVELFERDILVRDYGVRPSERMISHTGFLTVARKLNKIDNEIIEE